MNNLIPLLGLNEVTVQRQGETLLDHVSMTVHKGEIVTLIGPNGAGKSTLVKTSLGLVTPDSGKVIRSDALHIGYVPQNIALDPSLPVTVNRFLRLCPSLMNSDQDEVLNLVGASYLLKKNMADISGGEMRRVLLARSLLGSPHLLILDEPTSGVDITGQAEIYSLIQDIRERFQCGVLLVSHNLHIVMAATDRVICLNRHLCCSGRPDDVRLHPEFISLFGHRHAEVLGIYRHHHNHEHNIHQGLKDPI